MSWSTYVNLEIIALEIVGKELESLHESNIDSEDAGVIDYNINKLLDGYKSGYIIVTMLVSLMESFLNNLLNQYIPEDNDRLLRGNIEEKIDILYFLNNNNPKVLRGSHLYGDFRKMNDIRNELIHYKSNYVGDHSYIASMKISKLDLGTIFTKDKMGKYIENIKKLVDKISLDLGVEINYDVNPITSDGHDDNYRFATIKK